MSLQLTPNVVAQSAGALISLFSVAASWRRKAAPGGKALALLITAVAVWSVSVTFEQASAAAAGKLLFSQVSYAGFTLVGPLLLLFTSRYRTAAARTRAVPMVLLWLVPAIVLALTLTNGTYHLVWTGVTLVGASGNLHAIYGHAIGWWLAAGYHLALMVAATVSVGSVAFGEHGLFARQSRVILAALVVIWAGHALYVVPFDPFPGLDLPALSFSIAGGLVLWGVTRGMVPGLSPIARSVLVETMPDGLIVLDNARRVVDANPAALALLERDRTILGSSLGTAFAGWPDLAEAVSRIGDNDVRLVQRRELHFELTVASLRRAQGGKIGTVVSLRDITERRRAEEASAESERSLRTLLAAAQRQAQELELLDQVRTSLAMEMDLSAIFQTVVDGIARTFGYTLVSLYTLQDGSLVLQHQTGYPRVIERMPITEGIMGRVVRTGVPVLAENVGDDPDFRAAIEGITSEVCIPLMDQGKPAGVLNVESTGSVSMGEADLRLMTVLGEHVSIAFSKARLYAEARENEEQYRALVTTLGEGVAIVDLSERFVYANPAAESVFGVPPGGLDGRNLSEFLGETDLARSKSETLKRVQGIRSTYEIAIRRPGGESRQIELIAAPRCGRDEAVNGTLGIFRDVTELRRLQRSLEQERSLLLSLIDSLPDYVYLKDRESRFILTNKAQAALVGKSDPRELVGRTDHDFVEKSLADRYRADDIRIMESGIGVANIEERSEAAGGDVRKVLTTKVPIFDGSGAVTGLVGISRDVTELTRAEDERARLQDQLQQAQKMEAVGRLAGGIAHDFNNILTVIAGYCELALEESRGNRALEGNVEEIKRAARRAAALIAQLLAFSRRQILQPRVFDLGDLVVGMEGMLKRLLGEDIRLRSFRTGRSLNVHADPGRIEQVIMNLAVNSRDAMPGGGLLTIHTATGKPPAEELAGHPELIEGDFVVLSVSDTGQGMDPATLGRLFEPFFTTKDMGKGTGLGLATVYGIVRQSNGHITCRSEVGRGTTFTIYLPHASQGAADREGAELGPAKPQRGTEIILLVEDDESVRRFVKTILETAGYTVEVADSGLVAIEKLESMAGTPDLLLTDVIMPGMDGRVLAQEVLRRSPGTRLIYMSGYAEVAAGLPGPLDTDLRLIQKPFAAGDLLKKVREILEGPSSGA